MAKIIRSEKTFSIHVNFKKIDEKDYDRQKSYVERILYDNEKAIEYYLATIRHWNSKKDVEVVYTGIYSHIVKDGEYEVCICIHNHWSLESLTRFMTHFGIFYKTHDLVSQSTIDCELEKLIEEYWG